MNEVRITQLTISSSNEILLPALLPYLQHQYKYGTQESAVSALRAIFNDLVSDIGIIAILDGNKEPVFDLDDMRQNKFTFCFEDHELTDAAHEYIEDY